MGKAATSSTTISTREDIGQRVFGKTRGQEYFQYLIKWKDKTEEDATWMTEEMLQKIGRSVEELMDRSP